jgi:hypothetical protein
MKPPPIGTRFALHARPDGTTLCIIRTGPRYYEYEWRAADGQWWTVPTPHDLSLADAMRTVDRLAGFSPERWRELCAMTRLSGHPR